MKNILLLLVLIFGFRIANAQYVTIPDTTFRAALKTLYPTCFNASGMMDTTCSAIVNEDSLNVSNNYYLSYSMPGIFSLQGMQYFKRLQYLSCNYNSLTTLPPLPKSLVGFECEYNKITSLPALPDSIFYLACNDNQLTMLPVLPNTLKYFDCSHNQLTVLPTLPNDMARLYCSSNQLTNIPSLPYYTNYLYCANNKLTSLPVMTTFMYDLNCSNNLLTSLPALPNTLKILDCSSNHITTVPTLPNLLEYFFCNNNQWTLLPSLPVSLKGLNCSSNRLTSLPIMPGLSNFLACSYNLLTSLPPLNTITDLKCSNNQIISLPLLPSNLKYLYCDSNQLVTLPSLPNSMVTLKCDYNHLTSLPSLPSNLQQLYCTNNPLSCLPLLPTNIFYLYVKNTGITCFPNIGMFVFRDTILPTCTNISDICNINPLLIGRIYYNINNNGIYNIGEQLLTQQIVKVLPNNWVGVSDMNGNYLVKLDTSIINTWSVVPNHRYENIAPSSYTRNPKDTLGLLSGSYDFGIQFIPNVKDLETELGSSPARPGFTTSVTVNVNNVGTVNQSNITIKLKKPNGYNIVSTSISPISTINDTLIWNNISINYLEHQSINVQLQVPAGAVIGSTIDYEAWSNGTQGDSTPLDNYTKWTETIRGSFDPNDKLVNKTSLPPTYNAAKDRLLYTIRFQNTGTDTAFTVIVRDVIPDNLDVTSLRVVNASHPYQLIVREKNIVEVAFPNIQLPDKTTNESKSHGFVQLEFKPKADLPLNAEINNSASILFDYNAPVVTNTATTKIQITTGIANNKKLAFKLFPNPASSTITVELPYEGKGKWCLTDISGKIIRQNNIENNTSAFDIDVNDIANGTYLLSLEINDVVSSSKVVIVR